MPHISRRNLSKERKRELENRVLAFLDSTSARDRYKIFHELFTETEQIMFAKRLAMIALIKNGVSTHDIADSLVMSPSTVGRFERMFERGAFRHTGSWMRSHHTEGKIIRFAVELLAIPFKARRTSLARFVDEQWAKPLPLK